MSDIDAAKEALLDYEAADLDGVIVLASRQAIHEVVEEIERLQAELYRKDKKLKKWVACAKEYEAEVERLRQPHPGCECDACYEAMEAYDE